MSELSDQTDRDGEGNYHSEESQDFHFQQLLVTSIAAKQFRGCATRVPKPDFLEHVTARRRGARIHAELRLTRAGR